MGPLPARDNAHRRLTRHIANKHPPTCNDALPAVPSLPATRMRHVTCRYVPGAVAPATVAAARYAADWPTEVTKAKAEMRGACVEDELRERSKKRGKCVVSTRRIAEGEIVVEYTGKLNKLRRQTVTRNYSMSFRVGKHAHTICAKSDHFCLGRFVNHSRSPNLEPLVLGTPTKPRVLFFAKRSIEAVTELTFDYGDRESEAPFLRSFF
jgi:hypothetical protein